MTVLDTSYYTKRISFDVYGTVITSTFNNVEVMAIVDFETASRYDDVLALHYAIYPQIPNPTPDNPEAYSYLKIRLPNNVFKVIGIPWIREETIITLDGAKWSYVFNDLDPLSKQRLDQFLATANFSNFTQTKI